MKIINNRYKIDKNIYNDFFVEAYRVKDTWENNKLKFLKIYNYNLQKELIDYFINNQHKIYSIKHKNILYSEEFNIIKTIDGQNTNSLMYYFVSEYIEYESIFENKNLTNLKDKLNVLLDITLAINFLHFRGFTYKFLNPLQVLISSDKTIKLQNISNIIEKTYNNEYSKYERRFLSPDFIAKNKWNDKELDYYSLARMIEYLFLDDDEVLNNLGDQYYEKNSLNLFTSIIEDLENRDLTIKDVDLLEIIDEIIDFFHLDYKYDLIEERNNLFLENPIVGRDKELSEIMELDKSIWKKTNHTNFVTINGQNGIGKTRFQKEISHRLKLKNRNVYYIDIKKKPKNYKSYIAEFLEQSKYDGPSHLIEKYKEEFSMLFPELSSSTNEEENLYLNSKAKEYRLYNRLAKYLKELSINKTTYLLIDNIENSNEVFLNFLDYLVNNLVGSNIIFIFTFEKDEIDKKENLKTRIESWKNQVNPLEILLGELDLQGTGQIIQNTLGMAYIHLELSKILFKESAGNPKKIEELLAYLYNKGQLYMKGNGRWALDIKDFSEIYIPINIDSCTLEELGKININSYETLKIMSVLNNLLPNSIFSKMINKDKKLDIILKELIRKKLIKEKLLDWGPTYSISNIDLKKYIYLQIEEIEKIKLHRNVASAIEEFQGENGEALFEELIYHLIKSKQENKALRILLDKVESLENKSGSEAEYLLEKSYNIFNGHVKTSIKLEILEKLIYILLLKGELKEEDILLEEYINLAEKIDSIYHTLNHKRMKAEIYYQKGNEELFLEEISKIKEKNKKAETVEFKVYCLNVMANVNIASTELEKAEVKLNKALELALESNISDQLGNIYNMLGNVKYLSGNPDEARGYYEKSYEYFIEDRDVMRSIKPLNNLGNIYATHLKNFNKAVEQYEKGLEISRKHELKKMQIIFSINLSEMSKINYDYDKSLEYILQANKVAVSQQNIKDIALCQNLLGSIYLKKEEYDKAYDCYTYVNSVFKEEKSTDFQISLTYYSFLESYYFHFGKWDESIKYNELAKELYSKVDLSQYYKFEFKSILGKLFRDKKLNKLKLDKFIEEYKKEGDLEDFRKAVLLIALLSIKFNDISYARKYLEYDNEIKDKVDIDFLKRLRAIVIARLNIDKDKDNIEQLVFEIENNLNNKYFPYKTIFICEMASIFEKDNRYKEAIKYYIDALENIYKNTMKIPNWSLKISYIKSRNTDEIKDSISKILKKYYNSTIEAIKIDDIDKEENFQGLDNYFDIVNIINTIGKEEFSQITKIYPYGEVLDVKNTESLMSKFKDDYKYNLDLILSYLSKEAFATNGVIMEYDKELEEYKVISSLNPRTNINISDGILKIALRTEKGLLVRAGMDHSVKKLYKNILAKDITGVICVPVDINNFSSRSKRQRRNNENTFQDISGYIYLETNRVFNNFSEDILSTINNSLYLIYLNLEINKLKLIATTDKLTGAFTRKHYDEKFNELIKNSKVPGNMFSVLMLDLDKFKDVNDTYGHRKGDQVLREVSLRIKASIRSTDILGRYGGEEFIVLLKDTCKEDALAIGEKIRKNIESLKIEGIKNPITLSIGISLYPDHSRLKEDLIEKADQALYQAKQSGRNKVCLWDHQMYDVFESVDKLAGILTGVNEIDNKNILGIVQIVHLIEEEIDLEEKIYKFLGELLNIVDSETATLIIIKKNENEYYTRVKLNENFADTPILNQKIINRIIDNKKGEFLIDWDNLDEVSGIPNWKSIIVVPMIKNGQVKGLTYLTIPLNQKEFDFNALNIAKNFAGIFTALI